MTTTQYISALPTSTTVALTDIIPATQGSTGSGTGTTRGLTLRQVRGGFVASVLDYGADATGATDSTTAIQAAINSGAVAVYVPPGAFKFSTLTIPDTKYFNLFGCGNASILVQTGAGIVWPTQTGDNYYSEGYIRDLAFDGTAGTSHTINTTYVGGLTLQNLYFNNVPVGYSSIYVNGFTGHSTHDIRLSNIQVYSSTAGHSGIRFGQHALDGHGHFLP